MAGADGRQDRVGPEDRPQRRLACQRWGLLGAGGEQGANVIGVAGDDRAARHRRSHAESLSVAPSRAKDELDLALIEAQHLHDRRLRDPRRLQQARSLGYVDGPGWRWDRFADEVVWRLLVGPRRGLSDCAHKIIVTQIDVII
jgi:hypothetical protein